MATKFIAAILTASVLLLAAPPARADGLIVPFIGADFGGDAANCRQIVPCTSKQLSYGLGVSFMVGGVVGFEGEIADAPHFFGESTGRGDNHVLSVMGNMLVGIPIKAFRPYAAVGVGVLHTNVNASTSGTFNALSNNSVAFDVGGGAMVLFSQHVGIRGDLRYIRSLEDIALTEFNLESKQLRFGRGTIGLVLRF